MTEIQIDEQQREYLDQLRSRLADEHVGDYGHVRYQDALQYLIDHHEATDGEVGTAPTAEGEHDAESAEREESEGPEGDAESDETGSDGAEGDEAADGEESGGDAENDSGGSASRLQRMMGLLDDHDDVWEQTDSEEGRYAVTLPDGSTEHARTKDDVRALLFQHYE